MKMTIRKSVFETNSSSTHAICISNNIPDVRRDVVEFTLDDFGWESDYYYGIHSKACYLWSAIYGICRFYVGCDILVYMSRIKNILSHYNIKAEFQIEDDGYFYGIDHDEELKDFVNDVTTNEDLFMRYLFGDDSFIITGNDNVDEENLLSVSEYEDSHTIYYKGN